MAKVFDEQQLSKIIQEYLAKLEGKVSLDKVVLYGSYA